MTDPFEARRSVPTPPEGPRRLDVGLALQDALDATSRNWVPWLGVIVVMFFLSITVIGACIVPGIAVLASDGDWLRGFAVIGIGLVGAMLVAAIVMPPLAWGSARFALDALDGEARIATAFSPLRHYGQTAPPMLGVLSLLVLVQLAGSVLSGIISVGGVLAGFVLGDTAALVASSLASIVGPLVSMGWSLAVGARLVYAPMFVVEQGLSPKEAVTASWRSSSGAKVEVALLQVIAIVAMLIGFAMCLVGAAPATMIVSGMQASAYRQIAGLRAPE